MKNVLDVLRAKEAQLKELESQIESLRAAARILAESEDAAFPTTPPFGAKEPQSVPARSMHAVAGKAMP